MIWHVPTTPTRADGHSTVSQPVPLILWASVWVLAAIAVCALVYPVLSLPFHVVHDWNEGWNAYWSDVAVAGGALYPPADALVSNNYPPLSFYVVGLAGKLAGDTIVAGRAIALASFLLVAANIGIWLKLAGASRAASLFASLIFVCTAAIAAPHYLAMNDPQWLGHALETTGLVVLWRSPHRPAALVAASVLMLAGGWVKHLLIPLPLITALWLMRRSLRTGLMWTIGSLILASVLFGVAWLLYGSAFFENLFNTPRDFSLRRLWRQTDQLLPLLPLLFAAGLAGKQLWRDSHCRFVLAYLGVSLVLGYAASGGAGVDMNRYFDAIIAGSLVAGLLLNQPADSKVWLHPGRPGKVALYVTLLTAATVVQMATPLIADARKTASLVEREQAMLADVATLRKFGAAQAICETPTLCYWAGAPFLIDIFNFGQKQRAAHQPVATCEDLLGNSTYSVIALDRIHSAGSHRMSPACNEAISRHYHVAATSGARTFLVADSAPQP